MKDFHSVVIIAKNVGKNAKSYTLENNYEQTHALKIPNLQIACIEISPHPINFFALNILSISI